MNAHVLRLVSVCLAALLSACVSLPSTAVSFSPSELGRLEVAPTARGERLSLPVQTAAIGDAHVIEWLVEWHPAEEGLDAQDPAGIELADFFEERLRAELDALGAPAPGTRPVTVQARVTGFDLSSPLLNAAIALVIPLPLDSGGVTAEIRVHDARSGETLLAWTSRANGRPWQVLGHFRRRGHAEGALEVWARELAQALRPQPPTAAS